MNEKSFASLSLHGSPFGGFCVLRKRCIIKKYMVRIPKNFVLIPGERSVTSKLRYKLLADGMIIDQQEGNRLAGFICGHADLEQAWFLRGQSRQKFLLQFV